ncbi:MAG: hypothetical protein KAS32_09345 [Candidatus Peribacteraceae bacterium]|nr:hypothetical protein [Candidatus Peribacteraceae bacterium]
MKTEHTILFIALAIIGVGLGFMVGQQETQPASVTYSVTDLDDAQVALCDSTTTPDIEISTYDIRNPATALTEATNLYRKVGDTAWDTFTAGTAETGLEINTKYKIVEGISTSDFTDNAYGRSYIVDTGCNEITRIQSGLYQDEIETEVTATFYNKNHDASAETITAGQTPTVYNLFEAASKQIYGNPNLPSDTPNVWCIDLNSTTFDAPDAVYVEKGYALSIDDKGVITETSMDGKTLNQVSMPIRHSAVAGKIAYCYEAPVVTDKGLEIAITLNADDTLAPVLDDTSYIYAANWYIHSDTAELLYGVEDNNGNAVGTDAADSVANDFTA